MRLIALGVGSAFATENYQSNMIVEINGKRLLIDAGGDVRHTLKLAGLRFKDIDAIYISHGHGDHTHGLEGFALSTYYDPSFVDESGRKRKIKLIFKRELGKEIWNTLKCACALQGKHAFLSDFFDLLPIGALGAFVFEGTAFRLVQTVHFMDQDHIAPSYGLIWRAHDGRTVFLTTDAQYAAYLKLTTRKPT